MSFGHLVKGGTSDESQNSTWEGDGGLEQHVAARVTLEEGEGVRVSVRSSVRTTQFSAAPSWW